MSSERDEASDAGTTSIDAAGDATSDPGMVGIPSDDSLCQRLGVTYRAGCDDCLPETISCSCFQRVVGDTPMLRCNAGHCVLGVDCNEVCKGTDVDQLFKNWSWLGQCASTPICRSDAWCGNHGKCVGETGDHSGTCTTGELDVGCADPSDCWSNFCAADNFNFRACRNGKVNSYCNKSTDCLSGKCALYNPQGGFCTEGNAGDPCQEGDCIAANNTCALAGNYGGLAVGTCQPGRVNDPCNKPEQCQSKICLDNACASGDLGTSCKTGQDCLSGYCLLPPNADPTQHGICGSGNHAAICYEASNCKVGLCAMQRGSSLGLCFEGKLNDPCIGDSDCPGLKCNVPSMPLQGESACALPAFPCGNYSGICDAVGLCQFGKCVMPM